MLKVYSVADVPAKQLKLRLKSERLKKTRELNLKLNRPQLNVKVSAN